MGRHDAALTQGIATGIQVFVDEAGGIDERLPLAVAHAIGQHPGVVLVG